jgi:hypothetical protein
VPHGLVMLYLDGPISSAVTPRALERLTRAAAAPMAEAALTELEPGEPQWGV